MIDLFGIESRRATPIGTRLWQGFKGPFPFVATVALVLAAIKLAGAAVIPWWLVAAVFVAPLAFTMLMSLIPTSFAFTVLIILIIVSVFRKK